jgi:hypothetical protein
MIIGGTKMSAVYDDVIEDKIKLYDAGVVLEEQLSKDELYKYLVQYKFGDVETPKLPQNFSLNNSIEHFRDCINYDKIPITSKKSILNVIKDKIKLYDAGVILEEDLSKDELYKYLVQYKFGDVEIPKLPQNFSLNNSIEHFRDSIKYDKIPITSKKSILNVIKALEIISKV